MQETVKGDDEAPHLRGRAAGDEARQRVRGQVMSGLASQASVRIYLERKAVRNADVPRVKQEEKRSQGRPQGC